MLKTRTPFLYSIYETGTTESHKNLGHFGYRVTDGETNSDYFV